MELFIDEAKFINSRFIVPTPSDRVPAHLRIAGTELLGITRPTGEIVATGKLLDPLELARWGLQAVRQTGAYGYGHLTDDETGWSLLLRLGGTAALIHWTGTRRTGKVPYARLLALWKGFNAHVRELTLRLSPDFAQPPFAESATRSRPSGAAGRRRFPILDPTTRQERASRFSGRAAIGWQRWLQGEDDPLERPIPHEMLQHPGDDSDPWSHIDAEEVD